ncbi:sigma-70 family RNA polymerase sigma factor [Neobacillus drentensis]|jgi:RNA polymerase sigma-70 factor (ECF subfamily)|uniref:sigma-70 family RNA polymerase sigma factor n=1 Tax=Neobacillus drentensis TaxID=220684 RepID=UPI000BFA6996|nr:RNA polymerase factor sigma C [Bacillus sp. AFS006103]
MRESIENDQLTNLMNTYSTDLKKLAWRYVKDPHLVEDIVQEVFLKCAINLFQLQDICSIRAWLYTVTKNQCTDYLRTKYHQNVIPTNDFFVAYQITPELECMFQQTKEEIIDHIDDLPELYQEILYLFYVKELKLKEIQQYLNINISTVKTRLYRAKHLLKVSMM